MSIFLYGSFYRAMSDPVVGWLPKFHPGLPVIGLTVVMIGPAFMLTAAPALRP